jgi:hypothetical protein
MAVIKGEGAIECMWEIWVGASRIWMDYWTKKGECPKSKRNISPPTGLDITRFGLYKYFAPTELGSGALDAPQ